MESVWQAELKGITPVNGFVKDKVYDVLIVGAGITGLSTALELQRRGKHCIIAEAYNAGFGSTGGTTAHLNTILDTTYRDMERAFSKEVARLVAAATRQAIMKIGRNVEEFRVDCDFRYRNGYLFATDEQQEQRLEEIVTSARDAGIGIDYSTQIPLHLRFKRAAVFGGQAQFHVAKYLSGLAAAFQQMGGVLLQQAQVSELSTGECYTAATTLGAIKAQQVVYATHLPPGVNILNFRCAPYRSYAAALTLADGQYPEALVYDMEEPYHYYRTQVINGASMLIAGGFDHKTGHNDNTELVFREMELFLRKQFSVEAINYKWSSQYYTSADGLPYIGRLPGYESVYAATGFIGNGMVYGTMSATIIADLILGNSNELINVLSPGRIKPIAGFSEFVKENADVVAQFIGKRFAYEEVQQLAALAKGEARLADWEGKKVALYKDENGKVHALNPVCPHAKCVVGWNSAEKTWDCPCHGGRYAANGALLTGPARRGLEQIITEHIQGD